MLAICAKEDANKMCQVIGQDAKIIGKITKSHPKKLHLKTKLGATRRLRKLSGQPLPRIC